MNFKKGFTLIEILVTIAVIILITVIFFANLDDFSSRATVRARVTEISSFIKFVQERSSSDSIGNVNQVKVFVEDNILDSYLIYLSTFVNDNDIPNSFKSLIRNREKYDIEFCFIKSDGTYEKLIAPPATYEIIYRITSPTKEVETIVNAETTSKDASSRVGSRLVLKTGDIVNRSVDVYKTGLIETFSKSGKYDC